ncbi:ABC transporter permease [Paenibacillus lutrae]|uniref:ABC transporter permease subunit n=1 Tax=Paenibacillus lutrae TaxID=2078573 RepID=A0A7X3FMK9_9BACL|nr:ABC transporter permease [Paenibacillus lutrae]MVP02415.1 ABC transporter permease subunit [Paenibacillus lutrae]
MIRSIWNKGWPPFLTAILLLLLWQFGVMIAGTPTWRLPAPLTIIEEGIRQAPLLGKHISHTVTVTLLGFSIGSVLGLIIACVLHVIPGMKSAFYPLLVLSQNIPTIALAPLLMIWFGFGILPKLIVIALVCFFPVTVATLGGLSNPDPGMHRYLQMIGASRSQLFWKLELPYALPSVFSGLKISATYSVMGGVIAEWLGSDRGIGVFMLLSKSSFRTDRVFVAIVLIVVLSLLLFGAIALLEKWIVRWKTAKS